MKYDIQLIRACIFTLKRESTVSVADHLKSIYLERVQPGYEHMLGILKQNVSTKLRGSEAQFLGSENARESAVEVTTHRTTRGRRPVAYYRRIVVQDIKKQYKDVLSCKTEPELKEKTSIIANRFAEDLTYPKGIVCFLQFTFKLSWGPPQKFLAILNTDFKTDIVNFDKDTETIEYLKDVFEEDFNSTILYPYIAKEIIKKDKHGDIDTKNTYLKVDENRLKIHVKPQKHDASIFDVAGVEKPVDAQSKAIKKYEQKRTDIESLDNLKDSLSAEEYERVFCDVKAGDITFKVKAKYLSDTIALLHTPIGQGFIVKGEEITVKLGKHDLFGEGKIKKYGYSDIIKDDTKKLK